VQRRADPARATGSATPDRADAHVAPPEGSNTEKMNSHRYELTPVGWVASPLTDPAEAPKQGFEGAPDAWLVFEPAFMEAAEEIRPGDELLVLTWLDRASREVLRVHPRDDVSNPMRGVFKTRSADRPNPIGLHPVVVAAVEGNRIRVRNLEALDGTPIIDVKPVLPPART
jgi:tRNA-Thr(GGU) m(6)t(6)A37 methyltransferase TsaA